MKNKYIALVILLMGLVGVINAQCLTDSHSPFKNQGWLSCNETASPNNARGNSHWIMYDLGHNYVIDSIQIWNHNVWGETGNGAKRIVIDYSTDKVSWQTAGTFEVTKADGSWKYISKDVKSLNSSFGQYFLITVLETWDTNATCAGIAEVKFSLGIMSDTEDVVLEDSWAIYPNPAVDNLIIDLKETDRIDNITIVNTLGQVVKSINSPNKKLLDISIIDFQEGLYYVRFHRDGNIENKSFVKVSVR